MKNDLQVAIPKPNLDAMPKGPIEHFRVCNFCEAMCGIAVVRGSQADGADSLRVTPDKADPFSKGSMCPKAPAIVPLHFDPDRLRQPVRRVGSKWVEISWSQAYAHVASNLKAVRDRHRADAIATYLGNPIVHNLGMLLFVKTLTSAIGSRQIYSATSMDQLPHHFAAHHMFGHEFRLPVPDIDRTDYMILMGANPVASNGSMMSAAGVTSRLRRIKERGGKVVVLDPRRTETGKIASEHVFIQPGSDIFFLAAFLYILFRDRLAAPRHIVTHLAGWDELKQLVSHIEHDHVEARTGVELSIIERLAREFAKRDKAVIYGRMGLSTQAHGGLCQWLINCINIASGHFDREGGMMFPSPAIELVRERRQPDAVGRWSSRTRNLKEFYGELPVSAMVEEFETEGEGQTRAFITICGNPVLSTPGGNRLEQAFENLEFMVSIDNYINETTRHADIILPTPAGLEIDHYDLIFNILAVSNTVKFTEAFFPVEDDRPYDWQILKELAKRLSPNGLSLFDRWATPRRVIDWGLMLGRYGRLSHPKRFFHGLSLGKVIRSQHGIDLGPLRSRVPECLLTADRKIELVPGPFVEAIATLFGQHAKAAGSQDRDNDNRAYEFRLIGRRNVRTNNSWMHQFQRLSRSSHVRCTALINTNDAVRLDIRDGEDVRIVSTRGAIELPAEVTDDIMAGVISIPHGFGHTRPGTRIPHAEAKPGVSLNDITDPDRIDPLTGNVAFSGQAVRIEKVGSGRSNDAT